MSLPTTGIIFQFALVFTPKLYIPLQFALVLYIAEITIYLSDNNNLYVTRYTIATSHVPGRDTDTNLSLGYYYVMTAQLPIILGFVQRSVFLATYLHANPRIDISLDKISRL